MKQKVSMKRSSRLRYTWPAYGMLGVMLFLSLLGAKKVARIEQAKEQARFESAVDRTHEQFQRLINGNAILLDSLRGLVAAQLGLNPRQFQAYVEALQLPQHYPGVQGLGFAWRVTREARAKSLEKARQADASFHIWPESDVPESYPILYLAPPNDSNAGETGRDLQADPAMRAALERAAETGGPIVSPFFALGEGARGKGRGFLLLAPAYFGGGIPETRAEKEYKLFGFLFCSFHLEELFQVMAGVGKTPEIGFRIYDGADASAGPPLYASTPGGPANGRPWPTLTRRLALGDRTWTVVFEKQGEYVKGVSRDVNSFVALVGMVVSLLLFGMMLARGKARAAAEQHAAIERLSEARYRRLVEQSIVGIYVIQGDRFTYVNPKMVEIFGCTRAEDLTSTSLLDFVAEESRELTRENVAKRLLGEVESIHYELRGRRQDGRVIDLEAHGGLVEYDGQPAILGGLIDITARKEAEARLQKQLQRLNLLQQITRAIGERQDLESIFQVVVRSLEDHLQIDLCGVCLCEPEEDALRVRCIGARGAALAAELGLTPQALIAVDRHGLARCLQGQLVYEPDIGQVQFPFAQRLAEAGLRSLVAAPLLVESKVFGVLLAARCRPGGFSSGECEFLRQLSEHVALAAHQAQLYGALQAAYDELRQTQQAVMQQERLRALGQMASGIAHDINNAISPVTLYTEALLENEPNLSERARGYLQTIQEAIGDVAGTVSRMRDFYRPRDSPLALVTTSLNSLIRQVTELTRVRWSDMPQQRGCVVRLHTEFEPDLPSVLGVENEIRDALTNLIFNAVDAMPAGGTLTLRTKSVPAPLPAEGGAAARRVSIEVSDTGVGMDEETRRHCLEPFYTTKGERGTGLGLAMVFGMAQRHDAEIEIHSELGTGTAIRLLFAEAPPTDGSAVSIAPARPRQRLRLLTIDDDPLLIKSLRDALEGDGHHVTAVDGGQAGIDTFLAARQNGETFAAVITDLGMPHVDGRNVAAAIKGISSLTPVILLTGWGQRLVDEGDIPPHVDLVLSKPPKLRELREALAQCCPDGE